MSAQDQLQVRQIRAGSVAHAATYRALTALTALACLGALVGSVGVGDAAATTYDGAPVAGGWGPLSGYLGRYRLTGAVSPAPHAFTSSSSAGIFSLALNAARQLGAPAKVRGELSVFIRKVKTGEPLAPSGILSLFDSNGSNVLYLTNLTVHHHIREAEVLGGSFLGVPTGRFAAHTAGTIMTIDLNARGIGTVKGRLTRFSLNPTP